MKISRVGNTRDILGEGPLWDVAEQALYWIDSKGHVIHRLDWATGDMDQWGVPCDIGSMCLRQGGGAIVSLFTGLHEFDFNTADVHLIGNPEADEPRTRFNDGKTDRQGRFLAGTMFDDLEKPQPLGHLYRLDTDLNITQLDSGIGCSNGPAFSPDGGTLYFSDSVARTTWAYDYDTATGDIANKRVFVNTEQWDTAPDGGTVDAEGFYWSASVLSGKITRYDPNGEKVLDIDMPCQWPASVMFGGPDLDIIFVPSIANLRGPAGEEDGRMFMIEGSGFTGLPETRFKG